MVLIALSGGVDSMALLNLLTRLRARHEFELRAAHFDHGSRPGSAGEARRVGEWAEELGVACDIERAPAEMTRTQAGFRACRYDYLMRVARRRGADRIATAHHGDDQAETVLFRLLRGTGLRGLGGIPARRGAIVRPLLPFRRAELEDFVRAHEIPSLRDPANDDPRWARVRIRHQLVPRLGASATRRMTELSTAARRADRALDRVAWRVATASASDTLPGRRPIPAGRFSVAELRVLDPEMLARVVQLVARKADVRLRRGGTAAAVQFIKRGRSGSAIDIGGGLRIRREFDVLELGPEAPAESDRTIVIPDSGAGQGTLRLGGCEYRAWWSACGAEITAGAEGTAAAGTVIAVIAPSLARFPLELRGWQSGDRIRLAGGGRKLKRLFNDRRVPHAERRRIPVLARDRDVLCVFGVALAEGVESESRTRADPADREGFGVAVAACVPPRVDPPPSPSAS